MTLHAEEMGKIGKSRLEEKAKPTGFWIDGSLCGAICDSNDEATDWSVKGGEILGAGGKTSGYFIDKQNRIVIGAQRKPTGFYIENKEIYGPSKKLPWMNKSFILSFIL